LYQENKSVSNYSSLFLNSIKINNVTTFELREKTMSCKTKRFGGLVSGALEILLTENPSLKPHAARQLFKKWNSGALPTSENQSSYIDEVQANLPLIPPRPERPPLYPSNKIGSHKTGSLEE
jgi:hypothetical protein